MLDLNRARNLDSESLADILLASRRAMEYSEGITEDFFYNDFDSQDILIRQMTILGEAFRRLTPEFKTSHENLPYGIIIAMRNALVHDYDGISLPDLWLTIKNDLPNLATLIEQILLEEYGISI